ncbi:SH2 domain-containing adapter protein B-like isoform X3 [Patiria miniata]|uniref:SH2 domain-containing protein n=1 Tax=Patiria miniata TaxID=46514 RepID=A0A914BPJ5_PATMI|nr:SH2 domain-containing adapter protein B-like isoform X3 [Patiria miniata]
MEKLFRKIQGKKAPHPPKRDYTDKQSGDRRTKSSMSDSEDESGGGVFRGSNETSPRGSSPTPHGGNVERFRFGSQTSYGTGTVDLKSCGAGSGVQIGTNSRGNVVGGEGMLDTRRRNDSGGGPKSPNTKTPIVLDDYCDPKDVLKAALESGILPPRTEGPNPNRPFAEDDYSVPYEIVKHIKKQPPTNSKKQLQHQYEEPPDVSEITRRTSAGETPEESQHWEEMTINTGQEKAAARDPEENGTDGPMLSPAPDQTPQNDMRPQGEYDNPWEWRSHPLPRLPPESPGGEFNRSRSKSDVAHLGGIGRSSPESDTRPQDDYDQPWEWIQKNRQMSQVLTEKEKKNAVSRSGASTPDNSRRNSPKKPSNMAKDLKLELRRKHEVQGEKIDPNMSLDQQSFYHGKLSRIEAEKLLKPCKECSYLVRQSESAQKDYSLSLKSAKGFMHMKIVCYSQGYVLGEFSKPFAGIPHMIHYYTTHKLNIKGAEHMALLHPVENQML